MSVSDTIPQPSNIHSLRAIMKLQPRPGCEWCVMAYALNADILNDKGDLDDFYGMTFCLGGFSNRNEAEQHAKTIIASTGHPAVSVVRYGFPMRLETKCKTSDAIEVYVNEDKEIVELESQQYRKEKEEYEKRIKLSEELTQEAEAETDVHHIEHFKRQCYLAIKHKTMINYHTSELDKLTSVYEKCKNAVFTHYKEHPEHEEQWLPYLKEKLLERGELPLYNTLEAGYKLLRNELLGLQDDSS